MAFFRRISKTGNHLASVISHYRNKFVPINSFVSLLREKPLARLSRKRWLRRRKVTDQPRWTGTGRDGLGARRDRYQSSRPTGGQSW